MAASCESDSFELTQNDGCPKSVGEEDDVCSDDETQSNIGHKLLLKQGWQAGLGLGKDLQGPLDAVDIAVSNDELSGFGEKKTEVASTEQTDDDCECQEDEQLQQLLALDKEKAKGGSLAELKSSFYCELCDKQYNKHSEFDNHVNSYDHAHTQRLKELRQKDSVMKLGGSRLHDEKKLEKELKRISEFADAHAESRSPVGSINSEGQEECDEEVQLYATELQSLEDLDVDSENFSGLSQEQKVFLTELKAALELRQKDPDIDMDSIPLPPPPTTVFFHDDCHAPPLPGDIELDSIPMPVPSLDAIPMPDTLAPIPDSLPAGPAPLPGSCASAQAFLNRILGGGNSEEAAETGKEEALPEGEDAKKKHPTIIVQNRGGVVSFSLSKKNQAVGGPSVFETAAARMKPIKLKRKKPKQDDSIQSKIAEMEEEKRREEEDKKMRGDAEANELEELDTYGDSPKARNQRFKFVAFTKPENDKQDDKSLESKTGLTKEKMLGFIKVQSCVGDTELDWPAEMVQSTKCAPTICYSCNPLQFDYSTLFPGMVKHEDELAKKSSKKKRRKKKHSKKSKTVKDEDGKEGGEGEKNPTSQDGDSKKKKHKKKRKHKKAKIDESATKDSSQKNVEENKVKAEDDKNGVSERKVEASSTKADDSGAEGGDEQRTEGQKKTKKKKYHRRKKLSESKSVGDGPEETQTKEKFHRKPREEGKKKISEGVSGDEKLSNSVRKRKNKSTRSNSHEEKRARSKSGKHQSTEDKKVKCENVLSAVPIAAQTMEEEGGRVSDFETKEGVSKLNEDVDHAGKSRWDTSSDSEMETMIQMKEKLQASVMKEATAVAKKKLKTTQPSIIPTDTQEVKDISNHQIVKPEEKSDHRSRKDSEKSTVTKRKRKRSERDHSSDYTSDGDRHYRSSYKKHSDSETDRSRSRSRSYSTGSYTDSEYYTYTSDSDYTYGSYSRSRSRSPYYSYSSYSDDYYSSRRSRSYSRHRSRSYSRGRRRKRSFSRSFSRSYTRSRSRTRSRSYGRSRRSYDKDSSRHRREMKSSPDKQFSSVLPKKGPTRKKAESHHTKEPKHFDKEKLVAPVPKINTKEEVTQQAQELLQKVKDKKDDPESAASSKVSPALQIPSSSEKGPVLPLIGKAPSGARRRNPLDGDRKEDDVVNMETNVSSIPTPEESAKSIPLPEMEQPTSSSTPGDDTASTTTVTASGGKSFIGPKLPTDHPLAHKQEIPSPKDIPVQHRFQAIGPNDPLVFKKKSPGGPPVVIPPDQEDMYKKLQEQAQKHAEQRRREEAGILSSDSDDEEKATSEQGSEAELLQQQLLQDEIDAETILIPRELTPGEIPLQTAMMQPTVIALPRPGILTAAPQLAVAQPRAISLGGQLFAGHPAMSVAGMIPQPTMIFSQTGSPMYASSAHHPQTMFSQPQLQTLYGAPSPLIHPSSLQPTLQPALQPIGLRAYPTAFPQQSAAGFVHAIPGAGVAVQQPTLVRHILPQEVMIGQAAQRMLRPTNPF